jgi:transglycosylase-like protein
VWNWVRDNIFTPIINFVTQTIPQGFQRGVDAVRSVWNAIKAALRDPVQAAINVVWNNGIVTVWNKVADLVGLGTHLSPYNLPGFAAGGPIRGGTPGKDSVPIMAMPGEYVFSKRAVDAAGGPGAVHSLHSTLAGTSATSSGPFYATGGFVGPGASFSSATGVQQTDPMSLLGGLTGIHFGGGTPWASMLGGFVSKLASSVVDYLKGKIEAWLATQTAPGPGGAVVAGGGDARSWIIAHESGGNPRAQNPTSSASGLYQFIDGTWRSLGGSTAHAKDASVAEQNMIADRYIAQRYHGSWEEARQYWIAHGNYDRGGYLMPGTTMATNATGQPERILTPDQTRMYDRMTALPPRGDNALIAELRSQNQQLRALRGDVDQGGYFGALIAEVHALRAQLAQTGSSVVAEAQGARFASVFGTI